MELSDGTLRYLLWIAALHTPRPPPLMVLNEPETSLHPDLLPALARLITRAASRSQVWVVSHAYIEEMHMQFGSVDGFLYAKRTSGSSFSSPDWKSHGTSPLHTTPDHRGRHAANPDWVL